MLCDSAPYLRQTCMQAYRYCDVDQGLCVGVGTLGLRIGALVIPNVVANIFIHLMTSCTCVVEETANHRAISLQIWHKHICRASVSVCWRVSLICLLQMRVHLRTVLLLCILRCIKTPPHTHTRHQEVRDGSWSVYVHFRSCHIAKLCGYAKTTPN